MQMILPYLLLFLEICENDLFYSSESYDFEYNIMFNAGKSKNVYMSYLICMEQVYTDLIQSSRFAGRILSIVDQLWPDLGHTIASDFDKMFDIINRSNNLSRQVNNVLCFFDKRDTFVKLKLRFSYFNYFYGSVLWKLSHSNVERICSFWRMSVGLYVGHMHGLLNITHNAKYS
jgi:hypothetical protein